jgi:3-oxoacyl-(acyl-carrier-protein) synthase
VTRGVLAETTVVNRSPRGSTVTESGDGVRLGVVHADGGGTLVVRVSRGAVESGVVVLGEVGGAVLASDASEVGT